MPNCYSPVPTKMSEKEDGDVSMYHTMQTLPLNLSASEKPTECADNEVTRPGVDLNQGPVRPLTEKEDRAGIARLVSAFNGDVGHDNKPDKGGGPTVPDRDLQVPARPRSSARKRSDAPAKPGRRSRYDLPVGPLTNAPAVKSEYRACYEDDRKVPSPVAESSCRPLVPVVGIRAAAHPAEPSNKAGCPGESQVKFGHQLPAMVACPRPQSQSGNDGKKIAAQRKAPGNGQRARAPAPQQIQQQPQRQQPQQQPQRQPQHITVDPSYNLYMAVECHRATAQDEDGDTPLHIALSQEDVDVRLICRLVELFQLARKSLDVFNDMQQTPLHIAAITGNPAAARILVEHGANPNETDRNGQTAMHNVCSNPSQGACGTLEAILRYAKVDLQLDKRNYGGFTPMHISVINGQYGLTKLLIDHGANVNCPDAKSGWTPLFHAVTRQDAEHVQILLGGNAQVNMQSYSGNTALHVATGRGFSDIVRLLMRYGADMSLRNTHKDTPGMVATDGSMSNILRGIAPSSPSLGSGGSPRYSSPSPHQSTHLTNGVLLTKQSPSPQSINHCAPSPTVAPQVRPGDKKPAERSQRGGRRERSSRRSSAAKAESVTDGQTVPLMVPITGTPSSSSPSIKDSSDDATSATCRASVIVAPKSLKRRIIERTEREVRGKGSASISTGSDIPDKKPKTEPKQPNGGSGSVNGQSELQHPLLSLDNSRESQPSPSQAEPMDLTKRKADETIPPRVPPPCSPTSSASSFSIGEDKTRPGEMTEQCPQNEVASDEKVDANEETLEAADSEKEPEDGDARDEATETVDNASRSTSSKKEKKRQMGEELPPKKRK